MTCPHVTTTVLRAASGVSWDYGCPHALVRCTACGLEFYDPARRAPHLTVTVQRFADGKVLRSTTAYDHYGKQVSYEERTDPT